jgi:hypothetical protein
MWFMLFICPHAFGLWEAMKKVCGLPKGADLITEPLLWFQCWKCLAIWWIISFILLGDHGMLGMNSHTINPPSNGCSKRFLINFLNLLRNTKTLTADEIIKGKSVQVSSASPRHKTVKEKPPDKPWCRPPQGFVKKGRILSHYRWIYWSKHGSSWWSGYYYLHSMTVSE